MILGFLVTLYFFINLTPLSQLYINFCEIYAFKGFGKKRLKMTEVSFLVLSVI